MEIMGGGGGGGESVAGFSGGQYETNFSNVALTAVVMTSANGLVGTGFVSRYRLQPRAGFFKGPMGRCMATTPSSFSITSNRVTTNY